MALCKLCGEELPKRQTTKGRPQQYHTDCKSLITAIGLLENRLETWRKNKPSNEVRNFLRHDIISLVNSMLN
jgi:hypothetical protein